MTVEQYEQVLNVRDKIGEIRRILDSVMYGSDELPDKEYERIREAYNFICKANDKLP